MNNENELRKRVHALDEAARPSAAHDEAILASARVAAERARARKASGPSKRNWFVPLALAASFVIGMLAMRILETADLSGSATSVELTIPRDATRGGAGGTVPVEQVSAEEWFRYIQELTAAGEAREAQQHLDRFNELHPDFVYQP